MIDLAETSGWRLSGNGVENEKVFARLPVIALGMSLGSFLGISYVACVLFDLWFPALAMNAIWSPLLPGFSWLSWSSFFIGLIETFAYGWYVALVFGPLFNFFSRRFG